jgi:hypothetical protein
VIQVSDSIFTPGRPITVKAYKSDGVLYRWWNAMIETAGEAEIRTVAPIGHLIQEPARSWESESAIRCTYWFDKPYNLLEVYQADGSLQEIYIHIGSPPVLADSQLHYIDWELDVVRYPGGKPFLDDEDEFQQAAMKYRYSPEFQQACYRAVQEAMELAGRWVEGGIPREPLQEL